MSQRKATDWVNWSVYRRGWVPSVLCALLVLVTSFTADPVPDPIQTPSFTNTAAAQLRTEIEDFSKAFPLREPGEVGSVEAARWVQDQLGEPGLTARTYPGTAERRGYDDPVSVMNIAATLPGRTRETIVFMANRDTAGHTDGSAAATLLLIELARTLATTRDRRRTVLFVSTDGAGLGAAGAELLTEDLLARNVNVTAVISLDRIGQRGGDLSSPLTAAGRHSSPLGLREVATHSIHQETGLADRPTVLSQLLGLASGTTLFEQSKLLEAGMPVVTITGSTAARSDAAARLGSADDIGEAFRVVERIYGTLDTIDTLQSAGKTYVATETRVYRGWALKLFLASLLLPVWLALVDTIARHRRRWAWFAAVGSTLRACIVGLLATTLVWGFAAIGLLASFGQSPPQPSEALPLNPFSLGLLILMVSGLWLIARGPDWRPTSAVDANQAVLVISLLVCSAFTACALAVAPYSTIILTPMAHAGLALISHRVNQTHHVPLVWIAGFSGCFAVFIYGAVSFDTGFSTPLYFLQLAGSRTVPPVFAALLLMCVACYVLALIAARGFITSPSLPRLRREFLRRRRRGAAHGRGLHPPRTGLSPRSSTPHSSRSERHQAIRS